MGLSRLVLSLQLRLFMSKNCLLSGEICEHAATVENISRADWDNGAVGCNSVYLILVKKRFTHILYGAKYWLYCVNRSHSGGVAMGRIRFHMNLSRMYMPL